MANPMQQNVVVSPYPAPPEYAQNYTTANIKSGKVLAPPPVPSKFTVFGEEYNLEDEMIPSLTTLKIQQLYPSNANWRNELKKLNRSSVAAFLDLIQILIRSPDNVERGDKINQIRLIFINMHHLINEYRPIQARDTLRIMLENQVKEIKDVTSKLRRFLDMGNEVLFNIKNRLQVLSYTEGIPEYPLTWTVDKERESEIKEKPSTSYPQVPALVGYKSLEELTFIFRREKFMLEQVEKEVKDTQKEGLSKIEKERQRFKGFHADNLGENFMEHH